MRREYLDSMNADGFGEFLCACEELRNCKFIVAANKITALLKTIADNKQLYSMFGTVLYGFDYKATFSVCVQNNSFSLPQDPKTAIALVFRIFMDIDSGKMSLQNFLTAYFTNESINESYAHFSLEVISPFESYCRMLIANRSDNYAASKRYEEMNDNRQSELKIDALSCLASLTDSADNDINNVIDKAEYKACLNGLVRSIKADNSDDIISSFVGVKYAVAYFYKSNSPIIAIFKKLEYDVKHIVE